MLTLTNCKTPLDDYIFGNYVVWLIFCSEVYVKRLRTENFMGSSYKLVLRLSRWFGKSGPPHSFHGGKKWKEFVERFFENLSGLVHWYRFYCGFDGECAIRQQTPSVPDWFFRRVNLQNEPPDGLDDVIVAQRRQGYCTPSHSPLELFLSYQGSYRPVVFDDVSIDFNK